MNSQSDKLWRKNVREQQKRIKPGECQKYVRLIVDSHIMTAPYGQQFIMQLNNATAAGDFKYDIRSLAVKGTMIWERSKGQLVLALDEANSLGEEWQKEQHVVQLLTQVELQQLIKKNELYHVGQNLQRKYPGMQHIVMYLSSSSHKNSPSETAALIELQVMQQLNVLEVGSRVEDIVEELKRLNKAVAEAPYKQQKSEILGTFKKYLANDKKQCVRVEGSNGFGRLWQQHLNRLPMVTLEVAETIIEKYTCPKKLIAVLKNNENAVKELGDLKIKRSGPVALQTDRRIGSVLSYKLYMLYNSKDPNALI